MEVTVDSSAVRRVFAAYPAASVRRIGQLIESSAIDVQSEMRRNSPVHDGRYRRSVRYKINPSKLQAEIWPDVDYAKAVEEGTKPHWTSVKPGRPLRKWADDKGINPYAVQASIAKKGTNGQHVAKHTFSSMQFKVRSDIVNGFGRFIDQVDNGQI